jgi:peptidoglycan/LPS O-acetylase OafA/YrhL
MTRAVPAASPQRPYPAGKNTGLLIAAEAAAFTLASVTHFATGFTDAAIPELVIAGILALGSAAVACRHPRAWGIALAATTMATLGTALGLTIIATGRQDVPDLAYHASALAALAATLTILVRSRRPPR